MKKLLSLILALTMALSLVACGDDAQQSPVEEPTEEPVEETTVSKPKGFDGPVTLIVTAKAGGGLDVSARIIAPYMEKYMGVTVVVDNQTGGSGLPVLLSLAGEKKDSGNIAVTTCGSYLATPQQDSSSGFNPLTDLTPLASQGTVPVIFAAGPNAPAKTLDEFVAYAKEHPGELTFASAGTVNITGMAALSCLTALGLELEQVPTDGAPESIAYALGGHVDYLSVPASQLTSYVADGSITPLFDTGNLDENDYGVPNIGDLGYPDQALPYFRMMACGANTSDELVSFYRAGIAAALADPDCQKALAEVNDPLMGEITDPSELTALLETNYIGYRDVLVQLGML